MPSPFPSSSSSPVLTPAVSPWIDCASLCLAAMLLVGAILFHLIPALFAGMIVFLLIHALAKLTLGRLSSAWSKWLALALMAIVVVSVVIALAFGISAAMKSDAGLIALLSKMAEIIEDARSSLPQWISVGLPANVDAIQSALVTLLREHSAEMQAAGKGLGIALAHILIGSIIGVMLAFNEFASDSVHGPLSQALLARVRIFADSFRKVVFAQIKISAINTFLTGIYLALVLPMLGIHLPFVKTMIVLTFLFGLLPVIGNLISNTIVITVSVSNSLNVAIGSLVFLVLIHKAEYFLNAKIVGSQINAKAWELLLAMLLMEAVFGLVGLAVAPIFYAYLKAELSLRRLI